MSLSRLLTSGSEGTIPEMLTFGVVTDPTLLAVLPRTVEAR